MTVNNSSVEMDSGDEDILESLDEYSEENFESFTTGEIDEETA